MSRIIFRRRHENHLIYATRWVWATFGEYLLGALAGVALAVALAYSL